MDARRIGYWLTTGLVGLAMGVGGTFDILLPPEVAEQVAHLGYPNFFYPLLGVGKIAGAAVVLAPGLARLKEWAYAGIAIDLVAAAYTHVMVGDGASDILPPVVLLAVALTSWALRPDSRKLLGPAAAHASAPIENAHQVPGVAR